MAERESSTQAPREQVPAGDTLHCPGCLYSLRGLASEQCPECGVQVNVAALRLHVAKLDGDANGAMGFWFRLALGMSGAVLLAGLALIRVWPGVITALLFVEFFLLVILAFVAAAANADASSYRQRVLHGKATPVVLTFLSSVILFCGLMLVMLIFMVPLVMLLLAMALQGKA